MAVTGCSASGKGGCGKAAAGMLAGGRVRLWVGMDGTPFIFLFFCRVLVFLKSADMWDPVHISKKATYFATSALTSGSH
jgi:hypothetical protein